MLQPKKTKFRRMQKGRMKGLAQRGNQLAYGSFAIKALESTWITGRQIEAARQAITRYMKREGQLWIRIFPDKPITKKPAEVRMGKGKGNPEGFVAPVTPGRILFEAEGVPLAVAQEALRLGAQKLPITTKFIVRRDYVETTIWGTQDEKCRNQGPFDEGPRGTHRDRKGPARQAEGAKRRRVPVENPSIIKKNRRDIARMLTILRQKTLNK